MAASVALTKRKFTPAFANHPGMISVLARWSGAYVPGRLLLAAALGNDDLDLYQACVPPSILLGNSGMQMSIAPVIRRGPNAVTGALLNASGYVRITCNNHQFQSGERVTIRKVLGATAANGTWTVRRVGINTFDLTELTTAVTTFSTSAASICEVERPLASSVISALTTAGVFTTSAAHELKKGDKVIVSGETGMTGPTLAGWQDAVVTVATVPSTTTLTLEGVSFSGGSFAGTSPTITPIRCPRMFGQARLLVSRAINITGVTTADPAVFTTDVVHGLNIGDRIGISGALVITGINGTDRRVRTVPSTTTFTAEAQDGTVVAGASTHTASSGYISGVWEPPASEVCIADGMLYIPVFPDASGSGQYSGPFRL